MGLLEFELLTGHQRSKYEATTIFYSRLISDHPRLFLEINTSEDGLSVRSVHFTREIRAMSTRN